MTQSFFVGFIVKLFKTLKCCFDSSMFFKFQMFVSNLWKKLTQKSVVADYFKTYPNQLRGSAVLRNKILCFVRVVFSKVYRCFSNTFIFNAANEYFSGFFDRSVRAYGLFMLCASTVMLVFGATWVFVPFVLGVLVVSVFAVVSDCSLKVIFSNSVIAKFITSLFDIELSGEYKTQKNSLAYMIFHIITGIVTGLMAVYLRSYIIALLPVAIVALGFLIYDYRAGIFTALIAMPFAPTMGVVALVLVSFVSFMVKFLKDTNIKFRHTPLDTPIAIFTLIMFISSVTSFAPGSSIKIFLVYFAFVLGFYLTVNAVRSKKQLYALIVAMLFAGAVVAIYGIYQHIFGFAEGSTWTDTEMFEDIENRVISTFGNPNVLGEYLLLLIPVCAGFVLSKPDKFNKIISCVILALLCLCMVYTYSRGNWIGLIVAMILFFMFYDGRIVWLGVLFAFFIPMLLPQNVINRFMSVGDTGDTSTSYRVYIWMGTIAMLKDYWISGIGIGSEAFNMIYPFYSYSGIVAPHSHNLYLHIIVENGIMGIIAFLVIVFTYFRMAISTIVSEKNDKMLKAVITGLSAGMFGYLLQGMFDNVWYNYRIVFMYYIILALTSSAILLKKEADNQ